MHSVPSDRLDIVRHRLRNQRLVGTPFRAPSEVVSWHLAMQSQDFSGATWAMGQRLASATQEQVHEAFAQGKILRTHVLRPTWHFVAPADVRWLLALTAPRIMAASASYFRKHGLDAATLGRSRRVLEKRLSGGRSATREELALELSAAHLPAKGEALAYLLMAAELDGVLISGPRREKHHTYALLEERVAAAQALRGDEALAELAWRYLQGHGPALPQDLAWWASITVADAKRGIAANAARLASAEVDGKCYWFVPRSRPAPLPGPVAHLLPNYDEQLIAYRYRGNAVDPALSEKASAGTFAAHLVLIDGLLVGGWSRELSATRVDVTVSLLRRLKPAEADALRDAARRFASFLKLELKLDLSPKSASPARRRTARAI
jgi:hypothetical protein